MCYGTLDAVSSPCALISSLFVSLEEVQFVLIESIAGIHPMGASPSGALAIQEYIQMCRVSLAKFSGKQRNVPAISFSPS